MVRVNHTSGVSAGAVGCVSSSHLRSATERARARDDARRGLMAKSKLSSRFAHDDTRRCPTVSIPASESMNGLPVRVREEVEKIMPCCLPYSVGTRYGGDVYSEFDIGILHRHQLFSNDHAQSLDPEIRQWLPRIVCPAFPFSTWCQGGEQLGNAMLRHIETCVGFKTCFPGEHRKLFSGTSNPKPPLNEVYHLLEMTLGQLEFLRHKLADVSAKTLEAVLQSWRPIIKPGVEEVLPSDFPPVRMPSFVGLIDHGSIELEYGTFMDDCHEDLDMVSPSSSVVNENMEDAPELVYPELYLPPELLHPTSDPTYLAAAVAAHEPRTEETSPLVHVPFPSILEEVFRNCFEEATAPMSEYEWMLFSHGGDANGHAKGFHIQLHQTVAQSGECFNRVFA